MKALTVLIIALFVNVSNIFAATGDLCPNDANKTEPGICGCGKPETDSDNDGLPNCEDECPNDPRKVSPGVCGCGVEDSSANLIDEDGDDIPLCLDYCPGNKENKSYRGISAKHDWSVVGEKAYEHLGDTVSSAGDVNGDGYDDVIVGLRWTPIVGQFLALYLFVF